MKFNNFFSKKLTSEVTPKKYFFISLIWKKVYSCVPISNYSKSLMMMGEHFFSNQNIELILARVIYDRVWHRKNYFEIHAFLPIERRISRAGKFKIQSNVTLRCNWDVFVFIWISRSWSSSFEIQKRGNFKIIFPVPYPIIYNPDIGQLDR